MHKAVLYDEEQSESRCWQKNICINMSFHDSMSVGQADLEQGPAVEVLVRDDKRKCRQDSLLKI